MATAEAPPPPAEPDVGEVEILSDGVEWVVRVVGRSGGARPSATPLLLLGFWRADSPGGEREREKLLVGRMLSDLSPDELVSALEASDPLPGDPSRRRREARKGRSRRGSRGTGGGR